MTRFIIALLGTFLITAGLVQAEVPMGTSNSKTPPLEVPRWKVQDISFKVKKLPPGSPFDITFGATFRGPGQTSLRIPGFYNDNGEWVVRFSPTAEGEWTYETYSSLAELTGKSGKLTATPNRNSNQHGAVRVDPKDPRKFVYEDGTPYFSLAFELDWLFALDYGNKDDIPRTRQITGAIRDNGFNQVVMNVYAYGVNWSTAQNVPAEYEYKKPGYSPFLGTNEKPDFSGLNIDFFKHFDRVIEHLNEQGVVAHIMIYVWNKNVNWPDMYSWADNLYYDYIIARYQAYPNIIWDVSKEALDYGRVDIPYINERISRLRSQDQYKRLVTVHDYEYCSREPDKVDFISIQSWRNDLYSLMLQAYNRYPRKPVMNIEHGGYEEGPYHTFEGNYTSPEICLIRNLECVFAGVYSTYYWQNTSWNIVIYDPLRKGHSFAPPRFDYYRHMQQFFTKYNFNELVPSTPKITTNSRVGADNLASSGLPLSNGKDLFIYLVPASNYQINAVLPEPPGGKLEVTWFNPFTGEYKETGSTPWSNWKALKSPWKDTYSLVVVRLK
ncbi:DUF5060 domain-containing protein [Telluribacter sp.]|jgi:hypothetical protein|uniref:DUF5060 domain-containing protein n=1 Tax=Telluribacter sp. TaxID=1978767 RepID=UPI002E0F543B|nr:DUF5060 domain-containing protein [Telluribacter sp.]